MMLRQFWYTYDSYLCMSRRPGGLCAGLQLVATGAIQRG